MNRIKLTMSGAEVIAEMSDGNPGAIMAMMDMVTAGSTVMDPACPSATLGPLVLLDELKIYGSEIYLLHNDVCDRDATRSIAVLYALQANLISIVDVRQAMHNWGFGRTSEENTAKVDMLVAAVKIFIPGFASRQSTEAAHG
jgi:hypothetical protein